MSDPINSIAEWLAGLLAGWGLSSGLVTLILTLLGVVVVATFVLVTDIFLVWVERKVVARFQDRLGPNRLGPFGLIQPFADVIKLLIKEDITPEGADRVVYNLAPVMALATVLMLWAVIPFTPTMLGSDLNVGVLYVIGIGAIGTLGIIMAGWASNNKYALLGALRTVALTVAYEVPMVISLLVPVILARSMSINEIVNQQADLVRRRRAAGDPDFPDLGHRRAWAFSFRPGRSRIGNRGRLPHRIYRHEVRLVLRR